MTNAQLVKAIAGQAERKICESGAVAGTKKHSYAKKLLDRYQRMYGDRGLRTEVSVMNRKKVPYGTPGSVRLDVLEGPVNNPTAAYDYKFGAGGLTPSRIGRVQSVTGYGTGFPVNGVRP
jgi:hypothetical protein